MLTGVDEFLGVKLRYPIKGSSNDVSYKYLAFYVPEEIININNLVTKSRDDIGSFFYLSINYRQEDSWFEQRYTSKCICCGKTSSNSEYSHIIDNWFQLTFSTAKQSSKHLTPQHFSCSKSCGGGIKYIRRSCEDCSDDNYYDIVSCNTQPCTTYCPKGFYSLKESINEKDIVCVRVC